MNAVSWLVEHPSFVPADDLERLQLKIAQRADVISRETGFDPTNALENWRIAEREVLREREIAEESRAVRRASLAPVMWDGLYARRTK